MTTIASLVNQVAIIRARVETARRGRDWSIMLEEGEELSDELSAQLGPHDTVLVEYYPRGYPGVDGASTGGQVMSTWRPGPHGKPVPHLIRQYGKV